MAESKHDVSQLLSTFTPTELALIVMGMASAAQDGLKVSVDIIERREPMVAVVRTASASDAMGISYRIKAHEKHRPDGYYMVYDATHCRETVLWWSVAEGEWFETHKEHTVARGSYGHAEFIAGAPEEEKRSACPECGTTDRSTSTQCPESWHFRKADH